MIVRDGISVNKKIDELLHSLRDPKTHLQALGELVKMGPPVVDAVIGILKEVGYKDQSVGVFSCIVLGRIRDSRAVQALIDALKKNPYWEVRRRAAWALGEIQDQRAVDPLVDALTGDPNPDVRAFSAAALGKIGDKKALQALIQALNDLGQADDFSLVCSHAISALGDIGGHEAVNALIKIVRSGIPTSLVDATASLLTAFTGGEPVITYNDTVRSLAASILSEIGDKSIIQDLKGFMKRERSEFVKSALGKAVQELERKVDSE